MRVPFVFWVLHHLAIFGNGSSVGAVIFFDKKLPEPPLAASYDFIVVGSGSSGSVIANRLSEVRGWSVLLLEAGDEAHHLTDIPALASTFQFSNYNWGYVMERQENVCLGMKRLRCAWPRGKALGGSSVINYMIHTRGNRIDYDRWAAAGNPGWSYEEVLPYFIKSEDSHLEEEDGGYHGKGGYLTVSHTGTKTEAARTFLEAGRELGNPVVDYNGRRQLGFSFVQSTTRNSTRCSVEKAFLRPARRRSNLKISTRSRVTRIVLDPRTLRAEGVEFTRDGRRRVARATKEVVLSAGAFHSPQLLMLSGIGPADHLRDLGIPVLRDLPVGETMYDHNCFPGLLFAINDSSAVFPSISTFTNVEAFVEYLATGGGFLSTLGGVEALAYVKTEKSEEEGDLPDVELIFIGGGFHTDRGRSFRKNYLIADEFYERIWRPYEDKGAFAVFPMLLHPKSRGRVRLRSSDPFASPMLHGNVFTDPRNEDLRTFIAAIRYLQRLIRTKAFQRYQARLVDVVIPGCEEFEYDSDFYWECALRHFVTTLHHQVSTCKMGPSWDEEAVVDPRLRVYGVGGLRVADTSVIPLPIGAHSNAPAIMIGEKASDIIKEDWLQK